MAGDSDLQPAPAGVAARRAAAVAADHGIAEAVSVAAPSRCTQDRRGPADTLLATQTAKPAPLVRWRCAPCFGRGSRRRPTERAGSTFTLAVARLACVCSHCCTTRPCGRCGGRPPLRPCDDLAVGGLYAHDALSSGRAKDWLNRIDHPANAFSSQAAACPSCSARCVAPGTDRRRAAFRRTSASGRVWLVDHVGLGPRGRYACRSGLPLSCGESLPASVQAPACC